MKERVMSKSEAIRLLLVEDDVRLCRLVKDYLEVMLPGMDGFEVLRRLRMHSTVPVLMLTGRGEEADRIVGLEMGADDYLPKTSSTRELLARLPAIMRRAHSPSPTRSEEQETV